MSVLRRLGITGAFISVTTLFFAWGFITSNNDPLIVALRAVFDLNYTEALLTQLVFFLAYGLMSLPAASLGNRLGPVNTIVAALFVMVAGCLLVQFSVVFDSYGPILVALFVLATGITTLQVAANPLAAALGPQSTSHFRLTLAQTFNSLGVVAGVHFGSMIMLDDKVINNKAGPITDPLLRAEALGAVAHAFMIMAGILLALLLFVALQRQRIANAAAGIGPTPQASVFDALRSRWAILGAAAIGLYVGAEVSIGSIMINYLHQASILGLPFEVGGQYLANIYWMGALVGRFAGSFLLTYVAAPRLLAFCAMVAAVLCTVATLTVGPVGAYAALGVGLFNSIMFPTIFTITLERSGVSQSSTSGLLCLAIVGGAILPLLVGLLADSMSLSAAFVVPAIAYLFITWFAWKAISARTFGSGAVKSPTFH